MSTDESIKVAVEKPDLKHPEPGVTVSDTQQVEWTASVGPGASQAFSMKYSITVGTNVVVDGLPS